MVSQFMAYRAFLLLNSAIAYFVPSSMSMNRTSFAYLTLLSMITSFAIIVDMLWTSSFQIVFPPCKVAHSSTAWANFLFMSVLEQHRHGAMMMMSSTRRSGDDDNDTGLQWRWRRRRRWWLQLGNDDDHIVEMIYMDECTNSITDLNIWMSV